MMSSLYGFISEPTGGRTDGQTDYKQEGLKKWPLKCTDLPLFFSRTCVRT